MEKPNEGSNIFPSNKRDSDAKNRAKTNGKQLFKIRWQEKSKNNTQQRINPSVIRATRKQILGIGGDAERREELLLTTPLDWIRTPEPPLNWRVESLETGEGLEGPNTCFYRTREVTKSRRKP